MVVTESVFIDLLERANEAKQHCRLAAEHLAEAQITEMRDEIDLVFRQLVEFGRMAEQTELNFKRYFGEISLQTSSAANGQNRLMEAEASLEQLQAALHAAEQANRQVDAKVQEIKASMAADCARLEEQVLNNCIKRNTREYVDFRRLIWVIVKFQIW